MILSKSRYVGFRQYNPMKPVKHGIKVYVLCCALTGYIYGTVVYQGKGTTATAIMDTVLEHMIPGDLIRSERVLFVDNYYTSIPLAVTLKANYGLYLVGTYAPRKGAKKKETSYPFKKITASDAKCVERGWMRRATKTFCVASVMGAASVVVQALIWKDTKMCGFITTAFVGLCVGAEVLRSTKGHFKQLKIKAHDAILAYISYYGAVDRADRGIADFSISVRTRRWFMRVVFWYLDGFIWNIWCIVKFRMNAETPGKGDGYFDKFKKKKGAIGCRYRFQLELAEQLMAYALKKAIEEAGGDRTKVGWAYNVETGRFKKAETPTDLAAKKDACHDLQPLPKYSKHTFCQCCYSKTNQSLSQGERRRLSATAVGVCEACGWRYCAACNVEDNHERKKRGVKRKLAAISITSASVLLCMLLHLLYFSSSRLVKAWMGTFLHGSLATYARLLCPPGNPKSKHVSKHVKLLT